MAAYQGWDIWLDGTFVGPLGSHPLGELLELSRTELLRVVRLACCGRHRSFLPAESERQSSKGGSRLNSQEETLTPILPINGAQFRVRMVEIELDRLKLDPDNPRLHIDYLTHALPSRQVVDSSDSPSTDGSRLARAGAGVADQVSPGARPSLG